MAKIIKHAGDTTVLLEPKTEGGKIFPLHYHALLPEKKNWSYRLLDEDQLTTAALIQCIENSDEQQLRADWNEQVGHPIGWLTVYLPNNDDETSDRKVRFEKGPDLEITPPAPQPVPPGLDRGRSPDIGMDF